MAGESKTERGRIANLLTAENSVQGNALHRQKQVSSILFLYSVHAGLRLCGLVSAVSD